MGLLETLSGGLFGRPKDSQEERAGFNSKPDFPKNKLNESIGTLSTGALVSTLAPANTIAEMMGMPEGNFIGDSFYDTGGVFGRHYNQAGILEVERGYIMQQRTISMYPEVAIGIEEIMRDLFDKDDPLTLDINLPDEIKVDQAKIMEAFEDFAAKPFRVIGNPNTPTSLLMFNLLRQVYVDGHMLILIAQIPENEGTIPGEMDWKMAYGANTPVPKKPAINKIKGKRILNESMVHGYNLKDREFNIDAMTKEDFEWLLEQQDVKVLEKRGLAKRGLLNEVSGYPTETRDSADTYNSNTELAFVPLDPTRLVMKGTRAFYDIRRGHQIELDNTKLIQADFGLFDVMGARHGFLQYAFKYANQLQTLQDMLVPMRFRRSIARRIFNVDIGNMPQARATAYMTDVQKKFKYTKSYDVESGKIVSKDSDKVGIVEDYWFANRSGNKGTTVEMMDEAGNFADSLEDITYFNKKLYQAMFIPLRRVFESEAEYDYTQTNIETDELRFHGFLNRVRFVFNTVFTQMFRTYLGTRLKFSEDEKVLGEEIMNGIEVKLRFDNWFEQNRQKENFERALSILEDAKMNMGKIYSAETMMRMVFDMTPEDVQKEFNKIKDELDETSPYHPYYVAQAAEAEAEEDSGF